MNIYFQGNSALKIKIYFMKVLRRFKLIIQSRKIIFLLFFFDFQKYTNLNFDNFLLILSFSNTNNNKLLKLRKKYHQFENL